MVDTDALFPETLDEAPTWAVSAGYGPNVVASPKSQGRLAGGLIPSPSPSPATPPIVDASGTNILYESPGEKPSQPAPGTDTDKSPFSAPKGLLDVYQGFQSSEDRLAAERRNLTGSYQRRAGEFINREAASAHDIPSWNEEEMRAKFRTQPLQAFGSVGSIFAVIASAFTKRPMINALQGSAAAMEAIKAGDKDKFDHAFEAWKANTDLAIKRQQMEHQAFVDTSALFDRDMEAWHEAQKENALRFGNQKALFLLSNGMDKEYIDGVMTAAKGADELQQIRDNTTIRNFQETALKGVFDNIEKNRVANGWEANDPRVIANKLVAANNILGAQGAKTPIERIMLQHIMENPTESADDTLAFWTKAQEASHRMPQETLAVQQRAQEIQQEAASRGEPVSPGKALMQAESEWSESRGAAAAARSREQIASREKLAELSNDTKLAIAKLSGGTKREIAAMLEGGRDKRAELSEAAKKEVAGMNIQARKELEETLEKGRNARATAGGVVTKDRLEAKQALAQVQQEIDSGKLDGNDPTAVRKRTNELLGESATEAGRAKNLTAPENNVVTMAPTALKNMTRIMSLVDQSGNLITHVPESLIGEFAGEGDGINAYNITRSQLLYDLYRMNAGGVLSAKAMHSVEDLLPPGTAALKFKRVAFQTEMANLVDEVQDKVNQIEAQGKKIDPNIWDSMKQFGIFPSEERRSLLQRFRDNPNGLGVPELKALSRMPLSDGDIKALQAYIQQRINAARQ